MVFGFPSWWTCAGSGGVQDRNAARPQGQAGHPQHPSDPRGRIACSPPAPARTGAEVDRMIERAGKAAKLSFKAHPHMLWHACGYVLANKRARHAGATGLPRTPQYPAHGSNVGDAVQGFLAKVSGTRGDGWSPDQRDGHRQQLNAHVAGWNWRWAQSQPILTVGGCEANRSWQRS